MLNKYVKDKNIYKVREMLPIAYVIKKLVCLGKVI